MKPFKPMLANSYNVKKVVFPAQISPKLDGVRCLAHVEEDGTVKLWSRDMKPIVSMTHVQEQVAAFGFPAGTVLDGELYSHGLPFPEISGTVRRLYHDERSTDIGYHVYDLARHPSGLHLRAYGERMDYVRSLVLLRKQPKIHLVATHPVECQEDIDLHEAMYIEQGYEGAMVRTQVIEKTGPRVAGYETEDTGHHRRSWSLQKVKQFEDEEFRVIGIEEEFTNEGVAKNRTGKFVMKDLVTGVEFRASGITDELKAESWAHPERFVGQIATVKFFGKSKDGVPRHPNFKGLRPEGQLDAAV